MKDYKNFETLYVEKLKDIRDNKFSESSFELSRRTYEGTNVLLELLSFLGYDQVVDEFKRLDQKHASVRELLDSEEKGINYSS